MTAIELSSYVGLTALSVLTINILHGMLLSIKYNPVRHWPHRHINTLQRHHWTGYATLVICTVLMTLSPRLPARLLAQSTPSIDVTSAAGAQLSAPSGGWRYAPDAGAVYQRGDLTWTIWGFAERAWGPHSPVVSADAWRRVRQGMELDFPRLTRYIRPVLVYEVDLTDNAFFRSGRASQVLENLYLAIQHPTDASSFRALVGENTHIISREDNLSSGNLPNINRSLILEEHGSVNSFGTQFGVEVFRQVTPRTSMALAAQDNRGSLNTTQPRYHVGNSLAAKVTTVALRDTVKHQQLTLGIGVDYTRAIVDRTFTLASAIGAEALGGSSATGNKVTIEGDVAFAWMAGSHAVSFDAEFLFSDFSHSLTDVRGGYAMLQSSLVDNARWGDINPFVRVDVVRLSREVAQGAADQRAVRVGVNYNLPSLDRHVNVHVEYAQNHVTGPTAIIPEARAFGEVRVALRVSASRYLRH